MGHQSIDRIYHVRAHRKQFGTELKESIAAVDSGWRDGDKSPGRLGYGELLALTETLGQQLLAETARADAAEKLVYVPGVWACPKCKFQLVQSNLNASDGSVTARDTPGEKCPNCATPLWRTSYRDEYKHWAEGYEALLIERTLPAESRLHALSVLPSAPAWRAIETAPRDQTIVVAGDFEHDPLFGIATWHGEGWMLWWDCAKDGDGGTHHWPTHWMPLPSSPVSGGEEE